MLRKWFFIASVFAVAVLLAASDASQARERRLFGGRFGSRYNDNNYSYGPSDYYQTPVSGRFRGRYNDNYYFYSPADYSQAPATDMDSGTRRSFYPSTEATQPGTREMPVLLDVRVPGNAEITIEGKKTTQIGPRRLFISPPLPPGQKFTYDIKAKWQDNGREVTRDRHLDVHAGERLMVDLLTPAPSTPRR